MRRSSKEIDEWIQREQGQHFCQCGCGEEIKISRQHFWEGIPIYKHHHYCHTDKAKEIVKKTHKGKTNSQKTRKKMGKSKKGNQSRKGKHNTLEHNQIIRECMLGNKHGLGKIPSKEKRDKISKASQKIRKEHPERFSGENAANWQGGISFEPYCSKFNFALKEKVRDTYNRRCYLCGKTEEENGRRLDVHHIDGNKKQGCNSKHFELIPLCMSCHQQLHTKKQYEKG